MIYRITGLIFVLTLMFTTISHSCTTIAVGKEATTDGSVIVSHTDDALDDSRIVFISAKDHQQGSKRRLYYDSPSLGWNKKYGGVPYRYYVGKDFSPVYDTGENPSIPLGEIPQVAHTYAYINCEYPIINEHQLSVGETTCKAKFDSIEPEKGKRMLYSSTLARIALERCKKSREAVKLIGSLIEKYGYYGTGECLVFGDPEEAWVIEMCGYSDTANDGLWVAKKVGDNELFVSSNSFRIGIVEKDSPDMLYSSNLFKVCKEMGWWSESEGPLHWGKTVGGGEYHHPYYSLRRVWRIFSQVKPSANFSPKTTGPYPETYPFAVIPDKKISVRKVMDLHRDHYQGTEFDLTKDSAAGPFKDPTRYENATNEINTGKEELKGAFERPLSIYRCCYHHVSQSRAWLPDPVGGLTWIGFDKPSESVFMPIFSGVSDVPKSFTIGKYTEYDDDSMWWTFNFVANYINLRYMDMIKDLKAEQKKLEDKVFTKINKVEKKAIEKLEEGKKSSACEELTEFCIKNAKQVHKAWEKLFARLIVKYNDGYLIKKDGTVDKAGYPEEWLKQVGYENGPVKY